MLSHLPCLEFFLRFLAILLALTLFTIHNGAKIEDGEFQLHTKPALVVNWSDRKEQCERRMTLMRQYVEWGIVRKELNRFLGNNEIAFLHYAHLRCCYIILKCHKTLAHKKIIIILYFRNGCTQNITFETVIIIFLILPYISDYFPAFELSECLQFKI